MDDLVQSANLLPERMPTNVEILKQEFDVEKRVSREKNIRLQEDLGQCHYDMEIQKDQIQGKDQKYELLLYDFKKLGLENVKLKKELKGKAGNPSKRIKLEDDKKTNEL